MEDDSPFANLVLREADQQGDGDVRQGFDAQIE